MDRPNFVCELGKVLAGSYLICVTCFQGSKIDLQGASFGERSSAALVKRKGFASIVD
jgi:hypothetical protein